MTRKSRVFGPKWLLLALSLALGACASGGTMVTEQQARAFKSGVSTRDEVVKALGAPNSTTLTADGTRIDVYAHISARANAASYIPLVGLMAGGATGEATSATFVYDRVNVLKSVSTSSSATQVSSGLLNQN